MSNKLGGRTINVPKVLPAGIIPNASYNGAVTIGEKCSGPHCSIPTAPTSGALINSNLLSANPPPGAVFHYPSTFRLGNNSDENPRIGLYQNPKSLNRGPFNISVPKSSDEYQYIVNPETGFKVKSDSLVGQQILENYKNFGK